ncbi:RTA1 domain-containing protein [Histoplasma capsulatum var. duboisii H88]|uniref:RTA1 domain-containing protein n=2 Tax=Ajellomyces capsulatus TaxID=5037 RepID=F0U7Z4_AJEC8|nr:RTA1 domain-containing protein [Histoplasma capsulatum H143]EGC40816.1 RTA1 domain-containing protein [Histoplasma capsulatum var. duboisii H88]QSS52741.1 RTA1 domain-containing protein [Histoplasma capsulatum var. duboisii H88]
MGRCDFERNSETVGWLYCPSVEAAILFTSLYAVTLLAHIVQWFTCRKKFCWVIVMAVLWETGGFAMRVVSAKKIYGLWHFIPQQLLIILAPVWLNAFVYMVLGRMIYFYIPEKKIFGISAQRITLVFVLLDVFSMFVQSSSASLMSSDSSNVAKMGVNIYMGGIGLQEFFIIMFLFLAGRFQYLMNKIEVYQPQHLPWRRLLYTLYVVLLLITIRIIYRLIEFSKGMETGLATNEKAFYLLEAVPMFLGFVLFNIVHPSIALVGPESEFPKKDKKEIKRKKAEKKAEKKAAAAGRPKHSWRHRGRRVNDVESGSDLESEGLRMQDGLRNSQRYDRSFVSPVPSEYPQVHYQR